MNPFIKPLGRNSESGQEAPGGRWRAPAGLGPPQGPSGAALNRLPARASHRPSVLPPPGADRARGQLNRDQGLGVLFLRKRITYTLVMGLLIQTVSAMIVVNTTLMSTLHAKDDEVEAIGNEEVVIEEALGKAG